MNREQQINAWVDGKSIHNHDDGICCPDFSCCHPELMADKTERIRYKNSNLQQRAMMLCDFLAIFMQKK